MAVPQLAALVDVRGTTVRISLLSPVTPAPRPVLLVADAGSGELLYAVPLPDSAGSWQWKVTSVQDQVLLLSVDDPAVLPLPVLLNSGTRRVLAHEIKRAGRGCECDTQTLELLRLYHALALLLFAEGNYAGAQAHLTLLQDLEPCACDC